MDDGHKLGPPEIYEYLSRLMYGRRSEMNPLWNSILVGGFKDGKRHVPFVLRHLSQHLSKSSFLGYVDLLGTTYSASTLATGYGSMIAQPLLRKAVEGREHLITEEEAREIIKTSMKVLFYRDARSLNKYQIGTITAAGPKIYEAQSSETEWSFAEGIRGYGAQTQ